MFYRVVAIFCGIWLLLILAAGIISFSIPFSLIWHGNAIGAAQGVLLWGHYTHGYRHFAFLYQRSNGWHPIPGEFFLGFHYHLTQGLRLIGMPLWFPGIICGAGVWFFARRGFGRTAAAGHCRRCGYDLRASEGRCPECGTPIPIEMNRARAIGKRNAVQ